MQTRRDQLQAFRFQNRRALAALVTGDPNTLEPPMRRLTVTTLSGIMIAILVVVGFTVFGFIRPKAGDDWKQPGAVVIDVDDGQTYVVRGSTLHPTANYTSALLASGGQQKDPVKVERDDIADAPRGVKLGVAQWPGTPPPAGDLVTSPVTACSRQRDLGGGSELTAQVGLTIGEPASGTLLPQDAGIVVDVVSAQGTTNYLLTDGHRYALTSSRVAVALNTGQTTPLQVGTAFLGAVPAGRDLTEPVIEGAGQDSDVTIKGDRLPIGQVLVEDGGGAYLVLRDGIHEIDPVQKAVLSTVAVAGGGVLEAKTITQSDAIGAKRSSEFDALREDQLEGLPSALPRYDRTAEANRGLCAVYARQSGGVTQTPRFSVPPDVTPSYTPSGVVETPTSQRGVADKVTVPPGRAALVGSADGSRTTFLVADSGTKFAVASPEVLAALGYGSVSPVRLPAPLLKLVPSGPALSQQAAATPLS